MSGRRLRKRSKGASRLQRGSALLVVIASLGMIAALAVVISRAVSGAAIEMMTERRAIRAEEDTRAGIELAALTIFKSEDEMRSADAFVDLPDRRIAVRLTNERGRIDLNRASQTTLASIFQIGGIFDEDASSLAASLLEWRGGSASQKLDQSEQADRTFSNFAGFQNFQTQTGGELRKGAKQSVGTRVLFQPVQLASVPGFSREFVKTIFPYVTVASGSDQVDPYITPDRILEFLPGSSPDKADAFRGARENGNTGDETAIQLLGVSDQLVTSSAAIGWRVQVTVTPQVGRVRRSEAVIAVTEGSYRVLYIIDETE